MSFQQLLQSDLEALRLTKDEGYSGWIESNVTDGAHTEQSGQPRLTLCRQTYDEEDIIIHDLEERGKKQDR